MSESVAEATQDPSQEAEGIEPEAPAPDWEAQATEYKNRFAGSQKKLTETLNAARKAEEEIEALRKFKAEAERANMSELERLQAERDEARREAAAARSVAARAELARKYPLAVDFLGDDEPLTSEAKLQALNERLAARDDDETDEPPRIDPNTPRRPVVQPKERTLEDAKNDLRNSEFPGTPHWF